MWGKKGRSSPTHEGGGGTNHHSVSSGGGTTGGEGTPTLRRSGTVTGQLTYSNKDKSAQHDPQILNTQLQSVQMQLQEKHNELNYFKVQFSPSLDRSRPSRWLNLSLSMCCSRTVTSWRRRWRGSSCSSR
jgi:hypothetical protein